jgi:hypothetical protein
MKANFSKQYKSRLISFLQSESEGKLINITKVYEDYCKPSNKSPRQVLNQKYFKLKLECLVMEKEYEIEKIIKYSGKDVFVTYEIAYSYLNAIDNKNYQRLLAFVCKYGISKLSEEIPFFSRESTGIEDTNYYDLPF